MKHKSGYFFIITFFTLYFGMYLYIFFRFQNFLNVSPLPLFWIIMALAISFPLTSVFEKTVANKFTRFVYYFSSLWFGFLFYIVFMLVVHDLLTIFMDIPSNFSVLFVLGLSLLLTIYSWLSAKVFNIKKLKIIILKLKKPIKLVHLTDIHIGSIHGKEFLETVVKKVNKLNPDIVVITGDIVDGTRKLTVDTYSPLKKLKAPIYFCMGNHEIYYGEKKVISMLIPNNVNILKNKKVIEQGIQIVGVDHVEDLHKNPHITSISLDKAMPSILLIHAPIDEKVIQEQGYDLQLSGHTHNGQFFPFNILARLFYKRITGLHKIKNLNIYISPGTGTWGPPMRLGSRSEITSIELIPKK